MGNMTLHISPPKKACWLVTEADRSATNVEIHRKIIDSTTPRVISGVKEKN
jgi:hypothetical protein